MQLGTAEQVEFRTTNNALLELLEEQRRDHMSKFHNGTNRRLVGFLRKFLNIAFNKLSNIEYLIHFTYYGYEKFWVFPKLIEVKKTKN